MPIVDGSIADDEAGQQEVACKEVGDRQHSIARRGDDDGAEQSLELRHFAYQRDPAKFGRQYADCAMTMPIPNSVTMATLTRRPVQPRSRNAAGRLKTSTANSS